MTIAAKEVVTPESTHKEKLIAQVQPISKLWNPVLFPPNQNHQIMQT
jgi:hypothetical protein